MIGCKLQVVLNFIVVVMEVSVGATPGKGCGEEIGKVTGRGMLWAYAPKLTRTAMSSCRTRKRAFHFYSPGVAAVRHVRALQCDPPLLLQRY